METFPIRPLESRDRAGIHDALLSDGTFKSDEVEVALELVDGALGKDANDYWIRVCVDASDKVLGYVCFGPTPMTEETYDLYWLVTHKDARGKGVARRLVHQMEAELRDRGRCAIRVETSQTDAYSAARRFYEKCEYPEQARFPDFYRAGDDLVVYYKRL